MQGANSAKPWSLVCAMPHILLLHCSQSCTIFHFFSFYASQRVAVLYARLIDYSFSGAIIVVIMTNVSKILVWRLLTALAHMCRTNDSVIIRRNTFVRCRMSAVTLNGRRRQWVPGLGSIGNVENCRDAVCER